MFRPNVDCEISRAVGYSGVGKRQYGPWAPARCGIVHLFDSADPTSVRTDSSASRSSAIDENIKARILVLPSVKVAAGDRLRVAGYTMTVQSVFPRHAVNGNLDHYQLDLQIAKG